MRTRLGRPSPALAISILALFVALGGTSYAAVTITGKNVKNGSLTGADVKNSSLSGSDVKNSSLTGSDVKSNSLTGSDVAESKLGKVASAGTADRATSADRAGTASTAGTADNASKLGGRDASSFQNASAHALISNSCTVITQTGGISTTRVTEGECSVHFAGPVGGSALSATLERVAGGFGGSINVTKCGGASSTGGSDCNVGRPNTANDVLVTTTGVTPDNSTNAGTTTTPTDRSFYIVKTD